MIKLLAIDMDGTCLDPFSRFSSQNLDALYRAKEAGIEIVPTTGRTLTCLPHALKEHPDLFRYVITSNGAKVHDMRKGCDLFESRIPAYLIEEFVETFRHDRLKLSAHINNEYWVDGSLMKAQGRIVFGKDAKQCKTSDNLFDTLLEQKEHIEEIQLYFIGPGQKKKIAEKLESLIELNAAFTRIYVEIFDRQSSKGKALKKLCRHLNFTQEEVACIGDGENDVFMFEVAGISFAMGNAKEAIQQKATYVTASNRNNGVAKAIDQILANIHENYS